MPSIKETLYTHELCMICDIVTSQILGHLHWQSHLVIQKNERNTLYVMNLCNSHQGGGVEGGLDFQAYFDK